MPPGRSQHDVQGRLIKRRSCLVVDRKTVGGDDLLDIAYGTTAEGVRIIEDNTALLFYGDGVRRTRFVDRNTRAIGAGSKAPQTAIIGVWVLTFSRLNRKMWHKAPLRV